MKRISAFLLDFILLAIATTGAMLMMNTLTSYDTYYDEYLLIITETKESYNIPAIEQMTEEERLIYGEDAINQAYSDYLDEINNNKEFIRLENLISSLGLLNITISLLFAYLLFELIVPLILKNGQTIGKKVFSIAVMRNDGIKISSMSLFVRTILGKYTIETMVPVAMLLMFFTAPIMAIFVILLILLLQVVLLITSKKRAMIHDYLAYTVVVDFQSQMIFDSVKAKQEYQLRLHKEAAEKATY